MYWLNKIVWYLMNPMTLAILAMIIGTLLVWRGGRKRTVGGVLIAVTLVGLWFASTLTCVCLLGLPLERPFVATQKVESLPTADAVVVLGGGMGKCARMAYPEMYDGADRVWHAARLWKQGKAPIVFVTGTNELAATVPLLLDLGVAREAIIVDNESRNTYENSRFTERMLKLRGIEKPTVLLVTSAWHMTRAKMMFERYAPQVDFVPVATDYEATVLTGAARKYDEFLPAADALMRNTSYFKEWLGQLGYWVLRR